MRVPPFLYSLYERFLRGQLNSTKRPLHVGLIVDGNRRFALANGLATRKAGHMAGSGRHRGATPTLQLIRLLAAVARGAHRLHGSSTRHPEHAAAR